MRRIAVSVAINPVPDSAIAAINVVPEMR